MKMKRNVTSILTAAIATMLFLTSCGTGTSETETTFTESTTTETAEEQLTFSEITAQNAVETTTTTTTTNTAEQETEVISETETEIVSVEVVPPDSEFLLKMFDMWHSGEVLENGKELAGYGMGGSPAGSSHAFYADIDGDGIKEFCFIVDSLNHGNCMYVCNYIDNNWKTVDALAIGNYTYLQANEDGTTSLFVIKATRYVEEIYWYIYNGVEEEFDFLDIDKLYEELDKIDGMNEQEEFFHAEIEKNLERFDDLTNIYDLPHVDTVMLYDSWGLIHEDLRIPSFDEETVRKQLDEFTAEVAELFEQD